MEANNKNTKSLFEQMGGTYTLGKDGIYYPNLVLSHDEPTYGKYGRMRKRYLEEHHPSLYGEMLLKGTLVAYLNEIDQSCTEQVEQTVERMAKVEGVTEKLKSADWLGWLGRMNNIRSRAEEIICKELIYDGN
jgi:hypothetical protein